ncbi:MAG: chemotaxis protein CheX [Planctomyces sp.]|nr:chemotaxis protein CheX [Planctomyces sp.]
MKTAASASLTSQIVNPVISATVDTFSMMLDSSITRTGLGLKRPDTSFYDITAIIGLSGKSAGSFCLSFPATTAYETVHRMLDMEVREITPLVCDTVGEFANVIAGSAKDKLASLELEMGLPNIVHGTGHNVEFPSNSQPMLATFDSEVGPFMLAFGFVERG